uniref:Zinc/iron permease n=1 Tax=Chromera velia CCMP2878 TaxID=1169474 RepID=A0A0G4IFI3_9ALVE|eukprot:Cvel_13911.t1-p1 / transcript=Cvel_13911.t1 / gene=Cvel_13911 / organism=Chromera_velia_CCMP2878 / gene_product=Protein zntD, putative / transcript_product=Protein zntD, putative / location=Cvel_scaffold969:55115-59265(+) / protein_length=465 / sequence_SO=supercontig / SO=protein_coding / is_pseudo=false
MPMKTSNLPTPAGGTARGSIVPREDEQGGGKEGYRLMTDTAPQGPDVPTHYHRSLPPRPAPGSQTIEAAAAGLSRAKEEEQEDQEGHEDPERRGHTSSSSDHRDLYGDTENSPKEKLLQPQTSSSPLPPHPHPPSSHPHPAPSQPSYGGGGDTRSGRESRRTMSPNPSIQRHSAGAFASMPRVCGSSHAHGGGGHGHSHGIGGPPSHGHSLSVSPSAQRTGGPPSPVHRTQSGAQAHDSLAEGMPGPPAREVTSGGGTETENGVRPHASGRGGVAGQQISFTGHSHEAGCCGDHQMHDPVGGALVGQSGPGPPAPPGNSSLVLFALFGAFSFHGFMEGLGLGTCTGDVWEVGMAIVSHKVLESCALGTALIQSEEAKRHFFTYLAIFSLMTPAGITVGVLLPLFGLPSSVSGVCTALSAGTFAYISYFEVIPRALGEGVKDRLWKLFALLVGVAMMTVATMEGER